MNRWKMVTTLSKKRGMCFVGGSFSIFKENNENEERKNKQQGVGSREGATRMS